MDKLTKKVIYSGALGGTLLFLYGMVIWMATPLYETFFPLIPQYGRVEALLSELPLKESVMYQISDKRKPGLKGTIQIASKNCCSPYTYVSALFLNIAIALLLARYYVLHLATKGAGMAHVLRFYLFVGLVTHGLWQGVQVIWMSGDPVLHGILIADGLIGFLILGWTTGWVLGRAKK